MRIKRTATPNTIHWVERRHYIQSDYGFSTMIIERHDIVLMAVGERKTGVSQSGKAWSRWANRQWWYFSTRRRDSDGVPRLDIYYSELSPHGKRRFADVTSDQTTFSYGFEYRFSGDCIRVLRAAVASLFERRVGPVPDFSGGLNFGSFVAALAYPFLALDLGPQDSSLHRKPVPGLGMVLRSATARQAAERLVGKRSVRKDLIREAASAQTAALLHVSQVRGLVPVDWVVEMLKYFRERPELSELEPPAGFRDVLRLVPERRRRALILMKGADNASQRSNIGEACRALLYIYGFGAERDWVAQEVRDCRNWVQMHDVLARATRKVRTRAIPIKQDDTYLKVDGATTPDGRYRFVSPKDTSTLLSWGDQMQNCISSYSGEAVRHETYLLGVYDGEVLIANAEFGKDGVIQQLFGKYNRFLEDEVGEPIRRTITRLVTGKELALAA